MRILHVSDLHLRQGWHEEQGTVLSAFFADISKHNWKDDYVVFSGDLVHAGSKPELYDEFEMLFLKRLEAAGFSREKIISVSGNHDVDALLVESRSLTHAGIVSQLNDELSTNSYASSGDSQLMRDKFTNYLAFEACNIRMGSGLLGNGYSLTEKIGIYCLNSALLSAGGTRDASGNKIIDKDKLSIETRRLSKWLDESSLDFRILVLHHPFAWLSPWAAEELDRVVRSRFDLVFHGHVHKQQVGQFHKVDAAGTIISAPPLFTRKDGRLGYAIVEIADLHVSLEYRQWSNDNRTFVTGSEFSGTDDGRVLIPRSLTQPTTTPADSTLANARALYGNTLRSNLTAALRFYSFGTPRAVWVSPDIGTRPEGKEEGTSSIKRSSEAIASLRVDLQISALPQFGLTSLGHFLALQKYETGSADWPVVIDGKRAPNHQDGIRQFCKSALPEHTASELEPDCVIVDNAAETSASRRQIQSIRRAFPNAQIIVLCS